MSQSKHSPETLERLRANAEAAKRRLQQLNAEYQVRQKATKLTPSRGKSSNESFAQAITRVAKEAQIAI